MVNSQAPRSPMVPRRVRRRPSPPPRSPFASDDPEGSPPDLVDSDSGISPLNKSSSWVNRDETLEDVQNPIVDEAPSLASGAQTPSGSVISGENSNKPVIELPKVVEITTYHELIDGEDWDQLSKELKKIDPVFYKRAREREIQRRERLQEEQQEQESREFEGTPISPGRPRLSLAPSRRMLQRLPQSMSIRNLGASMRNVDPDKDFRFVSPLLKVDDFGQTPLHMACLQDCPEPVLLELLRAEGTAASQVDYLGRTPLHLAVEARRHDHILRLIIKAFPSALKAKDHKNRSPVGLGVHLAKRLMRELPSAEDPELKYHWGSAWSDSATAWQMDQYNTWGKVECLLKDLMRRGKSIIPSEHGLVLEAIEHGAPPTTVNRFISTEDKYLMADHELMGNALILCIERQYPLDTIDYLMDHCQRNTSAVIDYIDKALIRHYRMGCTAMVPGTESYCKQIISACKATTYTAIDALRVEQVLAGTPPQCHEWWEILRYLLFITAYGKKPADDNGLQYHHMVHASLARAVTPPSLIQLLLVVFPDGLQELCPVYNVLPVHLACTKWRYDVFRNDLDASMEKVFKSFLKRDKEQVLRRHQGRLPLHLALVSGQSWAFVKPILALDPTGVGRRDPHSKLFPFQLAAMSQNNTSVVRYLRNKYSSSEWRAKSEPDKTKAFESAEYVLTRRQVGTIWELLRMHPGAIIGRYKVRVDHGLPPQPKGAGRIAVHYLQSAYYCGSKGWRLNGGMVRTLRDSIMNGFVAKPLVGWWERLKVVVWEENRVDTIPQKDEYLLHACLYNADTPPLVVELLLSVIPMAATLPIPGTEVYPLHIACGTMTYRPQSFELPFASSNLQITMNAYKRAVKFRVGGQLPLHICLSRGKSWKEVRPLVLEDSSTLFSADPVSGLLPFQLIASFQWTSPANSRRYARLVEVEAEKVRLDEQTAKEKSRFLRSLKKTNDAEIVSTTFELFRCMQVSQSNNISDMSGRLSRTSSTRSALGGVSGDLDRYLQEANFIVSPAQPKPKPLSQYIQRGSRSGPSLLSSRSLQSVSSDEQSSSGSFRRAKFAVHADAVGTDFYDDDQMSTFGASVMSDGLQVSPSPAGRTDRMFSPRRTKAAKPSLPPLPYS
eukprot:Nitzschia sp. Nitz4//scaffold147_size54853//43677//47036//NITZ4_006626-RA/size54853-processed-gene-0.28-mRNA-1//-1//CDS//3329536720//957//frame0